MTPTAKSLPMLGGIDRSVSPLRADPGTFWDLLNFRQSQTQLGLLEQTPYFKSETLTRVNYNLGSGSTQESASGSVRMINRSLLVTNETVRTFNSTMTGSYNTALHVIHQITVPAATGLTKGCRIQIDNVQAIGWTLGQNFEIEIDAATTFKWRVNGGAYTTGVAITTTGVSIGGIITVWFLTASGFTVGDRWEWKRTDASNYNFGGTSAGMPDQLPYVFNKGKMYYIAPDSRVMMFDIDHVITVGYRPVYASNLTFFDDHLVLTDYSTSHAQIASTARACIIGCSDKTDYHTFFSTDVNEADTYILPNNTREDLVIEGSPDQQVITCVGCFVLQDRLFVVTKKEFYHTPAFGLPIVFSFSHFCDYADIKSIVIAKQGVYLITESPTDITFFDGSSFKNVGYKLGDLASTKYDGSSFVGAYNEHSQEFILSDSNKKRVFVYQERYERWYSRRTHFASSVTCIYATGAFSSDKIELFIGGGSLLFVTDQLDSAAPSYDETAGTVFATPKVTTQLFGRNLRVVKEATDFYLGYGVQGSPSGTHYSVNANVQFKLHWYSAPNGIISGNPSTDTTVVKTTASADGSMGGPRLAHRAIAYEVQVTGLDGTKPPMGAVITSLEPAITDPSFRPDR